MHGVAKKFSTSTYVIGDMALPENISNTSIPGEVTALTTLAKECKIADTEIEVNAKPPTILEAAGQFRIVVGKEIMLVTGGQTTTKWTVTRAQEGSTSASHSASASVFHFLTAGALNARYPSIGSTGHIAASTLPPIIPLPNAILTFGHSYGAGAMPTPESNRQSSKVAALIRAESIFNYSVGGASLITENKSGIKNNLAETGGYATIYAKYEPTRTEAPWLTNLGVVQLIYGINDWCLYGPTKFKVLYPFALKTAINRVRCSAIFEDSNANVTYPTGVWASKTFEAESVCSGTTLHETTSAEGTVVIKLPASYEGEGVIFGTVVGPGLEGSITVTDNTAKTIGSLNLTTIATSLTTHNTAATIRVAPGVLANGEQNVTLTYKEIKGGKAWFDWWGIEADTPPLTIIEGALRLTTAGYEAEGLTFRTSELTDKGIEEINEVNATVAEAYSDGRVIVASADAQIKKEAKYFVSDKVHPNTKGAGVIAGIELEAIAEYFASHPSDVAELGNRIPY